ncbi:mitochondrial intermembrane space import and assembly protein [Coniochaeta sp. 2T2.1]|nr:mitochondrial intermembrane space import and assembly protein [Coniochaeta sp. 2T2.1]
MYRTALRSSPGALRAIRTSPSLTSASRRFLTTAPAARRSTWKGSAARWGLAVAAVYWYNTSPIFADEPASQTVPAPSQFSDADLPTVEAVIEQKRRSTLSSSSTPTTSAPSSTSEQTTATPATSHLPTPQPSHPGSPEALEEEAGQQGAFNPETGEINWDCPCLGGMAHGPCGEDFKAAFSCFVFSEAEPKGMDCIDKFQHMQDCFRKYPEIYGAELQDEDDEEGQGQGQMAVGGEDGEGRDGRLGEVARDVKDKVEEKFEDVKESAEDVKGKVEEMAKDVKEKVEEKVQETKSKVVQEVKKVEAKKEAKNFEPKKAEHLGVPRAEFDATSANEEKEIETPGKQ